MLRAVPPATTTSIRNARHWLGGNARFGSAGLARQTAARRTHRWTTNAQHYPARHLVRAQQGRVPVVAADLIAARQVRRYRGEADESEPVLSSHEEALLKVAKPKSDEILRRHFALPNPARIPATSWGLQLGPKSMPPPEGSSCPHDSSSSNVKVNMDDVRRKRLIYRSKQRGWLEVDLLLGTWASVNVPNLTAAELDEFEAFVNLETIDIYNIITLRIDIPDEVRSGVVERIQRWARDSPLGRADPAAYAKAKADANLV